ncbi:MAG: type I-C CRISPR-associated protein Cas8c/Csd1 [Singulisphaera sp.]
MLKDASPFFALIVTGGQGRATLRGYFQRTVGEVAGKLRDYFDDIEIVRRFENSPRWPPLSWLVRSLAAQGKFENVDPDLAGRLFLAILEGTPFPRAVLSKAVARIRAEREDPGRGKHKHSRERLALIRATLNRQFESESDDRIKSLIKKKVTVMLDPECTNNAYCLGRLFAVLEKLQGDAIGNPGARSPTVSMVPPRQPRPPSSPRSCARPSTTRPSSTARITRGSSRESSTSSRPRRSPRR